jgi:ubiquitin C-terminal hydrolase
MFQQLSGRSLTKKTAGQFERNYGVLESFDYLFRPVNEEGDCEVCGPLNKRGMRRLQFIKEAPEVLLGLTGRMDERGRHKFTDGYEYDAEELLDLTQLLRNEEKLAGKTLHYRLVGIGLHKGDTPFGGHYTTIVKGPTGKWFYMDDQKTAHTGRSEKYPQSPIESEVYPAPPHLPTHRLDGVRER